VVIPLQSDAYAATEKASAAKRICLAKPIVSSVEGVDVSSQARCQVVAKLATAASLPAHGFPILPNSERQNRESRNRVRPFEAPDGVGRPTKAMSERYPINAVCAMEQSKVLGRGTISTWTA
jgi:hypothetical protein